MRNMVASLLSILTSTILIAAPVLASDLEEGAKLYAEGKYTKALPLLQKAAKFSPMSWQTHYYLANTNLALGRVGTAKYEYELCLRTCNKPDVIARCKQGIARAERHLNQSRPSTNASYSPSPDHSAQPSDGEEDDDADNDDDVGKAPAKPAMTDAQRVLNTKKEEIMRSAKTECTRIKKAATDQIEEEKANANQYWQDEEGRVFTSISREREAEIQREAEVKCQKVMEDAQRRLRSLGN